MHICRNRYTRNINSKYYGPTNKWTSENEIFNSTETRFSKHCLFFSSHFWNDQRSDALSRPHLMHTIKIIGVLLVGFVFNLLRGMIDTGEQNASVNRNHIENNVHTVPKLRCAAITLVFPNTYTHTPIVFFCFSGGNINFIRFGYCVCISISGRFFPFSPFERSRKR